jgi:mRNA-degrading endonuclease RelE of RelBE toxin-antitoxin system
VARHRSTQWRVFFRKRVEKSVTKMPRREQVLFANLVEDLERKGPIRTEWRNFSKLSESEYHCHLSYSWVACWRVREHVLEMEVYYAGSREDAPY